MAPVGNTFQYSGPPIAMPDTFSFAPAFSVLQVAFINDFTTLMTQLELDEQIRHFDSHYHTDHVEDDSTNLIQNGDPGATPEFAFGAQNQATHA